MDHDAYPAPDDFGFTFSEPEFALVLAGAALIRLIPLLVLISAFIKLHRFPELRALHIILLIDIALIGTLALTDAFAPALVPDVLRTSGVWSFLWIFAIAWLGVTWVRSAIKTRLRPRALEILTLVAVGALAVAFILPMAGLI